MKNKALFIKQFVRDFGFLLFALALVVTGFNNMPSSKTPSISPNYLINGTYTDTIDDFDYYKITGKNEYAVSLNDSVKTTATGTITVPTTYGTGEGAPKVTGIWHNAFHNTPATKVVLNDNIQTIDFEAFLYSGITSITIPYTVNEIGDAAFYCCTSLNSVIIINSSQESSDSATKCYCDENGTPIGTQSTETYTPSKLKKIPSYCFFKCDSLTDITFPSSLEEICEEAFNGCYNLSSDIYFQSIKIIRSRAFQGCAALRKVYISASLFDDPDGVGIEPHAFNYCSTQAAPNNLVITFCGDEDDIEDWVDNHPNWGWYSDRETPTGNKYDYAVDTSNSILTADWDYTVEVINGVNEVTITKYKGQTPNATTGYFISVPDHMPTPANNIVTRIKYGAFEQPVRQALKRLYLPRTLVAIDNQMFMQGQNDNYNNNTGFRDLYVVDDNTRCTTDQNLVKTGHEANIKGRIDLSRMDDLEYIGFRAFVGIGNGTKSGVTAKRKIKALRLPAHLRAIGNEAFGRFDVKRTLPCVTEFSWKYKTDSILETIGADAFYALGLDDDKSGDILGNKTTWVDHETSTLIFPKTFKHFANTTNDKNRYKTASQDIVHTFDFGSDGTNKSIRPAHAFSGCSLIDKVVFKGGSYGETTNLVIPLQTFTFNESLRTIVFEERENRWITFHTQQPADNYGQESIGGNAGRGKNDFRSEPFLQTLVLPNKTTKLRFQSFAFHANSRAAIYLSGSWLENMYSDRNQINGSDRSWTDLVFDEDNTDLTRCDQWKTVGNENYYDNLSSQKYWGYCFTENANLDYRGNNSVNTFDINQEIPVYTNVHYKDTIDINETPSNTADDLQVEVGKITGNREYVEANRCSFVCGLVGESYVATMTNYLYSLHDDVDDAVKITATVPETVQATFGETTEACTVNAIGDSAFSCCYCDGTDGSQSGGVGVFADLRYIKLPETIVSIGDYAFIRAYGVQKISAYTGNTVRDSKMPTALRYIGKSAFLFSGIQQLLEIPNECRFYENYTTVPTSIINDADNPLNGVAPSRKTVSTFSNALSLRRISFLKNSQEVDSSDYYETTTYTSTSASTKYTCAIYSKDNANLSYNKDRLLIVLNRNPGDRKDPSPENTDASVVKVTQNGNEVIVGLKFDGTYKSNAFLYGAYKMGYWIYELKCGKPTLIDDAGSVTQDNIVPQPMFSAVGTRGNDGDLKVGTKWLYLGYANYLYESLKSDLKTLSGSVLKLPKYGTNGCENLENVELPIESGATIPDGVFANNTSTNTKYYVENDSPASGKLDLTNSQYAAIGQSAFEKNSSIVNFTAPSVTDFTIGSSAFNSCSNLETVNLSKVSTNLAVNANAFAGCGKLEEVTFGATSGTVSIGANAFASNTALETVNFGTISGSLYIGANAFSGCTGITSLNFSGVTGSVNIDTNAFYGCSSNFTLNFTNVTGTLRIGTSGFNGSGVISITWPSNAQTDLASGYGFYNCDGLTTVTLPSNLKNNTTGSNTFAECGELTSATLPSTLTSIGSSCFANCNKLATVAVDGNTIAVTSIGESAFENCGDLDNFAFAKFAALTTIGKKAFQHCGTLDSNAELTLPSSVTFIDSDAFRYCEFETLEINSSTITLKSKCFANNDALEVVRFDSACTWANGQYNDGIFENCPNLVELRLPTGFNINNTSYGPSNGKYLIKNDTLVNIYTYTKYYTGISATDGWRYYNADFTKPLYFYVEDIDDLDPTFVNNGVLFWTTDANGDIVSLGSITAYNNGAYTFSNGYTFDSNGYH